MVIDATKLEQPHRRRNPLTGDWVLVSPHRSKRPWQGQVEDLPKDERPAYDPTCYLCAGNTRSNGVKNPAYTSTYVFDNDFAALLPSGEPWTLEEDELFQAAGETGICRVICFSPRHDLTLPRMGEEEIKAVIDLWSAQYQELGNRPDINHVQIFENKGEMMGCSNPHPHGQIWAQSSIPLEIEKKDTNQKNYFLKHGRTLLGDYIQKERAQKDRIILENEDFVTLVPFWAVWPFETMILPKRHMASIDQMTSAERASFAEILKQHTTRYDNLFQVSFPYSAGFHQAPTTGENQEHWHWHMVFYPPLLRSATVKKFMVGYEMLAGPQRDITAEQSAARLQALPDTHYLESTLENASIS